MWSMNKQKAWDGRCLFQCQAPRSTHITSGCHFQITCRWRILNITIIAHYFSWPYFKHFICIVGTVASLRVYQHESNKSCYDSDISVAILYFLTQSGLLFWKLSRQTSGPWLSWCGQLAVPSSCLAHSRATQQRLVLTKADPVVTHAEQRAVQAVKYRHESCKSRNTEPSRADRTGRVLFSFYFPFSDDIGSYVRMWTRLDRSPPSSPAAPHKHLIAHSALGWDSPVHSQLVDFTEMSPNFMHVISKSILYSLNGF